MNPVPKTSRPLGWGAALLALAGLFACSGKSTQTPESERGKRNTTIRVEGCKGAGFDTNRDGKHDLFERTEAGHVACRASDFDFDGVVDQTTYFAPGGAPRRREVDLDGNGLPNVVEHFEGGRLVLREIDAANLGRFDMWDRYDATGQLVGRERDTNGDGRVDQYWSYAGARITVRFDRNEDGVPDEEGALAWGETDLSAPPDAGPPDAGASSPLDAAAEVPQEAPEGALAGDAGLDGGAR